MNTLEVLDRTILLIRDFVYPEEASDERVASALQRTNIAIVADEDNGTIGPAQSAIVTLTAQALSYGASVRLVMPNSRLWAPQPPLQGEHLCDALVDYGADLVPGGRVCVATTPEPGDYVFIVGSTRLPRCLGVRAWRIGWTSWSAILAGPETVVPSSDTYLPIGALAAATIAAAEPFKAAVRELLRTSNVLREYDELAETRAATVQLAPE